jgi:hypothetical protein
MAVRAFFDEGPVVRRGSVLGLRVSRLLSDWREGSDGVPNISVNEAMSRGTNNLCAAGEFAVKRDLPAIGQNLHPRVLMLTDGGSECDPRNLGSHMTKGVFGAGTAALDVIAIDMKDSVAATYGEAASATQGLFMKVDRREELPSVLSRYLEVLNQRVRKPLTLQGAGLEQEIWPGEAVRLPAGTYALTLPTHGHMETSENRLAGISVRSGETTVLDLKMVNGRIAEASSGDEELPKPPKP